MNGLLGRFLPGFPGTRAGQCLPSMEGCHGNIRALMSIIGCTIRAQPGSGIFVLRGIGLILIAR
jgi:hypothetical protein